MGPIAGSYRVRGCSTYRHARSAEVETVGVETGRIVEAAAIDSARGTGRDR